jgi:hypothetical protein
VLKQISEIAEPKPDPVDFRGSIESVLTEYEYSENDSKLLCEILKESDGWAFQKPRTPDEEVLFLKDLDALLDELGRFKTDRNKHLIWLVFVLAKIPDRCGACAVNETLEISNDQDELSARRKIPGWILRFVMKVDLEWERALEKTSVDSLDSDFIAAMLACVAKVHGPQDIPIEELLVDHLKNSSSIAPSSSTVPAPSITSQAEIVYKSWVKANNSYLKEFRKTGIALTPTSEAYENAIKAFIDARKFLKEGTLEAQHAPIPPEIYYNEAFRALRFNSEFIWNLHKILLLALASASKPSVCSDLRYWNESWDPDKEKTPAAYAVFPKLLAESLYSDALQKELSQDPTLNSLRAEWVLYSLDRLKSRKKITPPAKVRNEDMVEPRRIWRVCYVKAIEELHMNPGGKGHHTLYWSMQHDPESDVRDAASRAYKAMRHFDAFPPNMSPRRPLMAAFWWFRQAQLISSGGKVDPRGAQRTRNKELRRIKEEELTS